MTVSDTTLNDPFVVAPPPASPMPSIPPLPGGPAAAVGAALSDPPPEINIPETSGDLPIGWLTQSQELVTAYQVRELNGYDEEALAKIDYVKNPAVYQTELLVTAVVSIGGEPMTKEMARALLIGDRDALVVAIARATYGNGVEFKLHCGDCDSDSLVEVELDQDIPMVAPGDGQQRTFTVPLKNGEAVITLLNGFAQEAFSDGIGRLNPAQLQTSLLAHSVVSINGERTLFKDGPVRALSAADRTTLAEFISEHQPGPQLNNIPINCATCGKEYPISLGIPALFRL